MVMAGSIDIDGHCHDEFLALSVVGHDGPESRSFFFLLLPLTFTFSSRVIFGGKDSKDDIYKLF